ncbi:MAG TPA: hypothetical protein VFP84_16110 [Kofleriaceae bacterium]|nr:hypothetical protein [Kofleriaceae bacterium]
MSLVMASAAHAAPASWCKGAAAGSADLHELSSKEPRNVIRGFVAAECSPNGEVEAHRAEIEQARAAWSKKLGMTEADWADAVAYAATSDDYSINASVSTKNLASATPLDQYALIMKTQDSSANEDAMYVTDMFDRKLSEVGRFAFLSTTCFDASRKTVRDDSGLTGAEVSWAICQADFEKLNLAKLYDELRADTAHDGAIKMKLRIAAMDFPRKVKDHASEVAELFKRDDANKQLFKLAADAREDWAGGVGQDSKLLDLVLAMESARIAESRKLLDGCPETTAAALAQAVSTIPAKSFTGFVDDRYNGGIGFATNAGLVIAQSPRVMLAAIAYVQCEPNDELSLFLKQVLAFAPGARGPRNAALGKLRTAKLSYDNVNAKLTFPQPKPYGGFYGQSTYKSNSMGGVVKAVKPAGDDVLILLEKTTITTTECIQSHKTNRIQEIRIDGSVRYEEICEKSGKVTRDNTWFDVKVNKKYASQLKPGEQFSAAGKALLAVWPSKTAKVPSIVLGGAVK